MAHIAIDDQVIGEGQKVRLTENNRRKQDYGRQVRSGRPV